MAPSAEYKCNKNYLANMSSIEAAELSSVSGVERGGSPLIEEVGVLIKIKHLFYSNSFTIYCTTLQLV